MKIKYKKIVNIVLSLRNKQIFGVQTIHCKVGQNLNSAVKDSEFQPVDV